MEINNYTDIFYITKNILVEIMKFKILLLIIIFYSTNVYAQQYVRHTSVIDTPTAYTIGRGTYQLSLFAYEQGGAEFKALIGLHDILFLGASVDVEHLIGTEKAEPNTPGVIAKLKFTDGWEMFPISVAIGYDSFYLGSEGKAENNLNEDEDNTNYTYNEYNRMIYGPYFVITKPIYLFNDEQHFNIGIRVPTQPDYVPEDTSYFTSLDIPLGPFFMIKGEMERVYYNFKRKKEWLYNWGIKYTAFKQLSFEFDFMKQREERIHRVIRVEFYNEF